MPRAGSIWTRWRISQDFRALAFIKLNQYLTRFKRYDRNSQITSCHRLTACRNLQKAFAAAMRPTVVPQIGLHPVQSLQRSGGRAGGTNDRADLRPHYRRRRIEVLRRRQPSWRQPRNQVPAAGGRARIPLPDPPPAGFATLIQNHAANRLYPLGTRTWCRQPLHSHCPRITSPVTGEPLSRMGLKGPCCHARQLRPGPNEAPLTVCSLLTTRRDARTQADGCVPSVAHKAQG